MPQERTGRRHALTDIRPGSEESGRPAIVGGWKRDIPLRTAISLAQLDGRVAAAGATEGSRLTAVMILRGDHVLAVEALP